MKIKVSNIIITLMLVTYFTAQILSGALQIAGLLVTLALAVVYFIISKSGRWALIFMALLLQMSIQRIAYRGIISNIKYFDELIEVAAILFLVYIVTKKGVRLSDIERIMIFFYGAYLLMCLFSSFIHSYASVMVIILDTFVCVKFFVFYRTGVELSRRRFVTFDKLGEILKYPAKCTAVILLIMTMHDLFLTPFFEKFDYRYFTDSIQLCFQHPTYLAAVCITLIMALICSSEKDKSVFKYIVVLAIVTVFTFRMKALGSLVVIFTLYFMYVKFNLPFKSLIMIAIFCAAIYLSVDQFRLYFTVGAAQTHAPIRLKMMRDGATIANDHFPFGAGFGSFGTIVSYENGSPFYYSMHYMYGYYKDQPVMDTFWSAIFAQSGWIGTVFFAGAILLMVIDSFNRIKENRFAGWCMLSIIITTLIESTSATAFFNPATAVMFLIYGIAADRSTDSERCAIAEQSAKRKIKFRI